MPRDGEPQKTLVRRHKRFPRSVLEEHQSAGGLIDIDIADAAARIDVRRSWYQQSGEIQLAGLFAVFNVNSMPHRKPRLPPLTHSAGAASAIIIP